MGSLEGEVEQLRSLNSALNSRVMTTTMDPIASSHASPQVSSLNEANEQLRTEVFLTGSRMTSYSRW